jgi:predicted nucleic acid-binding protein
VSYLIDSCALSELVKPSPAQVVVDWFNATASEALCVSVLTLGEIRRGVDKLPAGRRRERIGTWLTLELPTWFGDRILPIDADVANEWGRLTARSARPLPAVDSLIAATAIRHRLSVVTRNVADFAATGIAVVNPWNGS